MNPLVTLSSASLAGAVRDDLTSASALGAPVLGPAALLGDLELRLGLPPAPGSHAERVRRYAERMDLLRRSSRPFFAESARVDRLGTAEAVLSLRDALVEAGWSGSPLDSGGPRLDAIAALESGPCAAVPLPPGPADRLAAVERELAGARRPLHDSLSLLPEEQPLWPGRWRRVLDRLAALGTRLESVSPRFTSAPPDTDLGRLHAALSGNRIDSPLAGDGSLLALRAETSLELAEAVAAAVADGGGDLVLIRGGDASALDLALGAHGLATTGDRDPSTTQPLLQVLPLSLELLFSPRDPLRAIDLLLLRGGPIDPYLGRRLAAVLTRFSTVAGPRWQAEKARLTDLPDAIAAMEPWLEGPAFPDAAPPLAVLETLHRVQDWLREPANRLHPVAGPALDHAREVEAAVTASGLDRFTLLQLRALLDSVPAQVAPPSGFPTAGRVDHVDDPRLILRPRSTVLWWHFTSSSAGRHFAPWRRRELAALSAAGIAFPSPGDVSEATAAGWRRAAFAAGQRLVLAIPGATAGERGEAHPFWDEIVARLNASAQEEARITRRAAEQLRAHPRARRLPALPLPPPRREWRASPEALLASTHSPTGLEELLTCALRWALHHRAKVVPRRLTSLPDRMTLEGNLGHRLSELLAGSGALLAGPGAVSEAFPAVFERLVDEEAAHLRGPAMSFELDAIRRMLARAADALARLLDGVDARALRAEHQLDPMQWGKRALRTLQGRADLVAETAAGQRLVLDLKRKSATRLRNELKDGRAIQLGAYARALGARAAYFSLTHAAAVSTDAAAFGLSHPDAGPPVEDTWDRLERTLEELEALLAEGRVPVTGVEEAPELLEWLEVPADQAELHVPGPGKRELQERICAHCDYAPICGRRWEDPP